MNTTISLGVIFAFCFFAFIFVVIIGSIVKGLAEWASNNRQPVRSDGARVVVKRTEVGGHTHANRRGHTWTSYFCTFELDDGSRHEFCVSGPEYGLLAEGDEGTLAFQGTRYRGFRRRAAGLKSPLESQADF
jgi:Protein of unknown function (DUF2500)